MKLKTNKLQADNVHSNEKEKPRRKKKAKKNAWCDITAERILETHRLYPNKSLKNKHPDKKKDKQIEAVVVSFARSLLDSCSR